jgi:orotate phosphoribosyltransferase-like protein
MVKPEIVDRIRELAGQGLGSKRIAREVHVSRNSVRRYLAGATAGFQAFHRLNAPDSSAVWWNQRRRLLESVPNGPFQGRTSRRRAGA